MIKKLEEEKEFKRIIEDQKRNLPECFKKQQAKH